MMSIVLIYFSYMDVQACQKDFLSNQVFLMSYSRDEAFIISIFNTIIISSSYLYV